MKGNNEILKAAIFRSHFEAAETIPDEHEQLLFLKAVIRYQLYGEIPEGLPPIANALMIGLRPVLDKELEYKTGGRPEYDIPAEELQAKVNELGSKKAAADFYGISERTVYNKLQKLQKPVSANSCKLQKLQKTNTEYRMQKEECENEEEREVAQVPPALLENPPSKNSVQFPAKQAKRFIPPSVEEVQEYCKQRGNTIDAESFVAFYESKGWYVGKNKMKDWRQAVITWEKRAREKEQARASPVYQTWVAPSKPELDEEERLEMTEVLNGMVSKIKAKVALGGV